GGALAQSPYEVINELRAEATCAVGTRLVPLRVRPMLEQAAAAHARGEALGASIREAGYRAVRSKAVRITGDAGTWELIALLRERHCTQFADPMVTEVG